MDIEMHNNDADNLTDIQEHALFQVYYPHSIWKKICYNFGLLFNSEYALNPERNFYPVYIKNNYIHCGDSYPIKRFLRNACVYKIYTNQFMYLVLEVMVYDDELHIGLITWWNSYHFVLTKINNSKLLQKLDDVYLEFNSIKETNCIV
jgi:hypothetical protein